MPKELDDLTNKKFGDIYVLSYAGNKYWNCECSTCGKELKIRKSSLIHNYIDYKCKHTAYEKAKISTNFIDLLNKRFGDLTVIEYIGNPGSRWKCRCICGKEQVYESTYIRNNLFEFRCNHTKSSKNNNFIDLTDLTFGDLHILGYAGNRIWNVECICGRRYTLTSYNIRKYYLNKTYKCRHTNSSKLIDLTDKQFGDMKVIKYLGDSRWLCRCKCGYEFNRDSKDIRKYLTDYECKHLIGKRFGRLLVQDKLSNRRYRCTCDCGNTIDVLEYNLIYGHTKSCGCFKKENSTILNRDEVIKKLEEFYNIENRKPFFNELHNILCVSYSTAISYIHKYKLEEYVQNTFRSIAEVEISNIFTTSKVVANSHNIIDNKELDIYIPDKKVAIEYNGIYWHSDQFIDAEYHQNKTIECTKKGIRLIHIFEYEWINSSTNKKLRDLLEDINNPEIINRVYARNLTVTDNIDKKSIIEFEDKYHLQGSANSNIDIALIDDNNEIYAVMTFGIPRFNSEYQYEIIRLCYKSHTVIVGGIEKLFNHFLNKYKPESIITYVDISKFRGNSYLKIGFKPTVNPITPPNYVWVDSSGNTLTRYKTQKKMLVKHNIGDITETEDQIMHRNGYYKIYNSGNLKLDWKRNN